MSDTIEVATFGCRVNIAESEIIRQQAGASGLGAAYIVNSCAVTGEAVRQARQSIRRAFRADPRRPILVTGCAAQIAPAAFAAMPEVTGVIGNRDKLVADTYRAATAQRVRVSDVFAAHQMEAPELSRIAGHTRGFVQVQSGCDHRCTFCVIPFGRGASQSLEPDAAVAAVRRFVAAGAREVVLTGIDLASYRTPGGGMRLGDLVRQILDACPDLPRLRLSSLDCIDIDARLIALFSSEARLMPSLHLSLQSGADLILKRMKRRHGRDDAIALCHSLKRSRPDLVISADIIAGFPTETDEHFAQSLALIDACLLDRVHAFAYSPRPGTPAARMPPVSAGVIKQRAARLRSAGEAAWRACLARHVGSEQHVLAERGGIARTPGGIAVAAIAEPGTLVTMRITGHDGTQLQGIAAC